MKKRFGAMLLVLCMVLSLVPMTALAADSFYPELTVPALGSGDNKRIDEDQYYLLTDEGTLLTDGASETNYNIYYHDSTITLNNAKLKTGLYIPGNVTLELIGENTSDSTDKMTTGIQAMSEGNVTIQGTGSYTPERSEGIVLQKGNLNICENVTLDLSKVTSNTSITVRDGNLSIGGSAKVEGKYISSDKGNVEISGNAEVNVQKIEAEQQALAKGSSKVKVIGVGIYGHHGIEVTENAEVYADTTSVSLNAFYGPILIDSTKKLVAKTSIGNGAAIAAGVSQATGATNVTIKSEVEASGFVGIAANGTNSNVVIDGGKVTANSPFIGLYTQANEAPGIVDIKNSAVVQVTGTGNATPGIATYSRNPQPINIENSTVSVYNCGYGLSGSAINLKDSNVTVSSTTRAFLATPTLDYSTPTAILAGENAKTAEMIPLASVDAGTYANKYVSIIPAPEYTITYKNGDEQTTHTVTAGNSFEAPPVSAKNDAVFIGWSDGTNTYYVGQTITPTGNMTLTAQYEAIEDWKDDKDDNNEDNVNIDVDVDFKVDVDVDVSVSAGIEADITDESEQALGQTAEKLVTSVLKGETPTGFDADDAKDLRDLANSGAEKVNITLTVGAKLTDTPSEEEQAKLADQLASGEAVQMWQLTVSMGAVATTGTTNVDTVSAFEIHQTAQPIEFTLTTKQNLSGKNVRVLYIHDGAVETADSTVTDAANGVVTVQASKFSPYAILSKTRHSSSSSSGTTTYPVAVADKAPAGGTVRVDRTSAAKGATVTVTATAETGYAVGSVTVTGKDGQAVAVTAKDGKYTFVMPAQGVTVAAVFQADAAPSGDWDLGYRACPKDSSCPIAPFADAQATAWYHDGVHFCLENGLMVGTGTGIFQPGASTSRAMLSVMLWRLNGSPVVNYAMPFTDVAENSWYGEAVRWAASRGIVTGYDAQTFGPNNNVTREQMVTILYRYAQSKGYDVSIGEEKDLLSYVDAASVSVYAAPAMQWACGSGLVQGTDNRLDPQGSTTRAQMATMMMRFCAEITK